MEKRFRKLSKKQNRIYRKVFAINISYDLFKISIGILSFQPDLLLLLNFYYQVYS